MNDPRTVLASLAIGVLAGLGVGSGGLLVIWLTLVCSVPQIEAQAANLLFFIFSAGTSLIRHFSRRTLNVRAMFILTAGGVVGSFFGSRIAKAADPALLRSLFGVLLLVSGVSTLFRALKKRSKEKNVL